MAFASFTSLQRFQIQSRWILSWHRKKFKLAILCLQMVQPYHIGLWSRAQSKFMTIDPNIYHKSVRTSATVPLKTIMTSKVISTCNTDLAAVSAVPHRLLDQSAKWMHDDRCNDLSEVCTDFRYSPASSFCGFRVVGRNLIRKICHGRWTSPLPSLFRCRMLNV